MNIYWLEQNLEAVPCDQRWLSACEVDRLRTMRFPKRRMDWLLGRWTAKNAVSLFLDLSQDLSSLREIEIHADPSGAPAVYLKNESAGIEISLSHRGSVGACVIATRGAILGCDLELAEAHSEAFTTDYFNADEQALISECHPTNRSLVGSLIWSAKESALKAMKEGLRLDTRLFTVVFPAELRRLLPISGKTATDSTASQKLSCSSWNTFQVRYEHGGTFHGWWARTAVLIRTVVAAPPPLQPIVLFKNPAWAGRS